MSYTAWPGALNEVSALAVKAKARLPDPKYVGGGGPTLAFIHERLALSAVVLRRCMCQS